MKLNIFKYLLLLPAFILTLTSCRNDDDNSTITINIEEVGHHDTHGGGVVSAGEELHLEAEIKTTHKIANINVQIAPKTDLKTPIVNENFTNYNGQLNADFHQHIDIPATAKAGDYVVIMTVKDQNGKTESKTADLKIEENSHLFSLEFGEVGHNGHGHIGEALSIKARITSINPIAEIVVELHNEKVKTEEVEQSFTYYNGKTEAHFSESITVPATFTAGDYHLHFTVKDNKGNHKIFEKEIEMVKH